MRSMRSFRRSAAVIATLALAGSAYYVWQRPDAGRSWSRRVEENPRVAAVLDAEVEGRATAFCGGCHRMPDPAYFTRDRWYEEVERGYRFHAASTRTDLAAPAMRDVAAYFRERAPARLAIPSPRNEPSDRVSFRKAEVGPAPGPTSTPAVSFLRWTALEAGRPPALLACDMRSGDVLAIDSSSDPPRAERLATVGHPAHVAPSDLDGDGATDLVVADLGSFLPEDHGRGRVVWLRRTGPGRYEPVTLLDGLGRVADVRPGDFDGDGDQDLVVAEFGWQNTGAIRLLVNETPEGAPRFTARVVDDRHGGIHVPVTDWNGDGRDDFFAVFGQEHETAELFLADGDGGFRREVVCPPEDPAFGTSGIEAVDLDGDGDRDLLYTNGDTFDSYELKPYHGIRWVENRGPAGWKTHLLTTMPGVHRALAGDLDGDGDADVVAAALLPDKLFDDRDPASKFDSLVWLEQTAPGRFTRHGIERGASRHAALELADFNGDGLLDIAVGNFQPPGGSSPVSIWNRVPAAEEVAGDVRPETDR